MGSASVWIGHEGQHATYMWPYMVSQLADEYDRRYGLDTRHLHAIAELDMANAKDNPLAHRPDHRRRRRGALRRHPRED